MDNLSQHLIEYLLSLGTTSLAAASKPTGNGNATAGKQSPSGSQGNQKTTGLTPSTSKAGSTINLNPFSGLLWERREPL